MYRRPVLVDGTLGSVGPLLSITVLTIACLVASAWRFGHEGADQSLGAQTQVPRPGSGMFVASR
jgi:hypothetical protein